MSLRSKFKHSKVFILWFLNTDKMVKNKQAAPRILNATCLPVFRNQRKNTYTCLNYYFNNQAVGCKDFGEFRYFFQKWNHFIFVICINDNNNNNNNNNNYNNNNSNNNNNNNGNFIHVIQLRLLKFTNICRFQIGKIMS